VKSKKNPHLKCPNVATKGEWCSRHIRTKVPWVSPEKKRRPFTKREQTAGKKLVSFFQKKLPGILKKYHGPALYCHSISQNENDMYSLDSITTIPFQYHFSYKDEKGLIWTFDIRFLLRLISSGIELKNPFTQELIPSNVIQRLQHCSDRLRIHSVPIVYLETDILTPEQLWNQKVLDVFLKLHAYGYSVNLLFFEQLSIEGHQNFYRNLYTLWHTSAGLTDEQREQIIPGHSSGRSPLFRWHPNSIENRSHDCKWWRKQTINLMNTFLTRSLEKDLRGCGALYVLTAFAQTHRGVAQAFPYLLI
jgi:hypothetical protein